MAPSSGRVVVSGCVLVLRSHYGKRADLVGALLRGQRADAAAELGAHAPPVLAVLLRVRDDGTTTSWWAYLTWSRPSPRCRRCRSRRCSRWRRPQASTSATAGSSGWAAARRRRGVGGRLRAVTAAAHEASTSAHVLAPLALRRPARARRCRTSVSGPWASTRRLTVLTL